MIVSMGALTLEDVVAAAEGFELWQIAPAALLRMQTSRRRVEGREQHHPVYALNLRRRPSSQNIVSTKARSKRCRLT